MRIKLHTNSRIKLWLATVNKNNRNCYVLSKEKQIDQITLEFKIKSFISSLALSQCNGKFNKLDSVNKKFEAIN